MMSNEMYKKYYNYTLHFYDCEKENFLTKARQEIEKMLCKNYSKMSDETKKIDTLENAINDFFFLKFEQIKNLEPGQWLLKNVEEYFENYYEPLEKEERDEIARDFWNDWTAVESNREEIEVYL